MRFTFKCSMAAMLVVVMIFAMLGLVCAAPLVTVPQRYKQVDIVGGPFGLKTAAGVQTLLTTAATGAIAYTPIISSGVGFSINSQATLTTGSLIELTADNDVLTTGNYIRCLGGTDHATEVFALKKSGALVVQALSVKVGTATVLASTTAQAAEGNVAVNPLKNISTRITAQTPALTTAAYPSGSIIVCTHATPTVTLPAVATSAGVEYTIVNGGAGTTSFTIAAATACILSAGAATGNASATTTSLVWSASNRIVGVVARFVCDGTNWIFIGSNYQPTTLT